MFLEQQISILEDFWRSCDTEDWSNDAENSGLHHRNKLHLKNVKCKIEKKKKKKFTILFFILLYDIYVYFLNSLI